LLRLTTALAAAMGLAAICPSAVSTQDWTRREFPLAPPNSNDNFVAPYFDGFYQNEDGTYTLSFGFMNRNDEDVIEIALGPDNFIEPAEFDGGQPTSFPVVGYSGFGGPRERGAFGVVVPADFEGDVWWTLTTDGYTTRVPGRLVSPGRIVKGAYELSTTPMAAGSLRPRIRFTENGPEGFGIEGIEYPENLTTSVGVPIDVRFWAFDRGDRELGAVNMTLWKHRGPVGAAIAFESLVEAPPPDEEAGRGAGAGRGGRGSARRGRPPGPGPVATGESIPILTEGPEANQGHFTATFDTPGQYIIRIRIDNFGARDSSPGNQCCWSNAYVTVSVIE
jgi:hypothetical protein